MRGPEANKTPQPSKVQMQMQLLSTPSTAPQTPVGLASASMDYFLIGLSCSMTYVRISLQASMIPTHDGPAKQWFKMISPPNPSGKRLRMTDIYFFLQ